MVPISSALAVLKDVDNLTVTSVGEAWLSDKVKIASSPSGVNPLSSRLAMTVLLS